MHFEFNIVICVQYLSRVIFLLNYARVLIIEYEYLWNLKIKLTVNVSNKNMYLHKNDKNPFPTYIFFFFCSKMGNVESRLFLSKCTPVKNR